MTVADIDLWEIDAAFAAVPTRMLRHVNIGPDKHNVKGRAVALGHPIGGSGPMLIQTALTELARRDLSAVLITMCAGGRCRQRHAHRSGVAL